MRFPLLLSALLLCAACGESSSDSPQTPPSAKCGPCPADTPICYHVLSGDGTYMQSAKCLPIPLACEAKPTCDCALEAYIDRRSRDASAYTAADKNTLPMCPGALQC